MGRQRRSAAAKVKQDLRNCKFPAGEIWNVFDENWKRRIEATEGKAGFT